MLLLPTPAATRSERHREREETIDARTAAVNQVRAGAEVSRPVRFDNGLSLSPFGEVHVRRDGGVGQTGTGLEVVAGTRHSAGRVRVDAQGRLLVLHSASGYRERGAGVTLGVGNQDQEGLSLSVSPRCGRSRSTAATCRRRWAASGRWTQGASTGRGFGATGC